MEGQREAVPLRFANCLSGRRTTFRRPFSAVICGRLFRALPIRLLSGIPPYLSPKGARRRAERQFFAWNADSAYDADVAPEPSRYQSVIEGANTRCFFFALWQRVLKYIACACNSAFWNMSSTAAPTVDLNIVQAEQWSLQTSQKATRVGGTREANLSSTPWGRACQI